MDLPAFRNRFGEFEGTEDGPILACLNAAEAEVSTEAWGARWDEAHGLTAAHKLALSPYGTAARLITSTGEGGEVVTRTSYELTLEAMKRGLLTIGLAGGTAP